jgi:alpha-L-rhamnosidase
MAMIRVKLFATFFLLILQCFSYAQSKNIRIVNLKTEYTATPLGIDVKNPRFSWQMTSVQPGCSQSAYQIQVTDEQGTLVWNSGKKLSDVSLNIKFAGKELKARTRYQWNVKVWDQQQRVHEGNTWFETGLMDPSFSAWSGARWIGGGDDDLVLYPQYLPVFKLNVTIQLDQPSASTRAGFIYGANDSRLLDSNKNHYHVANKPDSSYILAELDIAPLALNEQAVLNIYRAGYKPGDRQDKPFKTFRIPAALINIQNKYLPHTLYISSVMGATEIGLDGENKENFIGNAGLNSLGQGGDFIAFPVLGQYGFHVPANQKAYFSSIQVRNYRSPCNALYTAHSSPLTVLGGGKATVQLIDPARNSMPMVRTIFSVQPNSIISKARLYVTARGVYDVYLNGQRIGNDYFNPGLTQYNKTHLYQTFDVTPFVTSGKNALGAVLGEGWWSGGSTYMGNFWNFFGDRQSLFTKLVITYKNGKEETIVSDPKNWRYFNDGPVVYSSFFQGEVYDATKEGAVKNWSLPDYNDLQWKPATEIFLQGHISTNHKDTALNMALVDDYESFALIGQYGPTVEKTKEVTAISVEEVKPGVFVYDLGQNIAGVPHITLSGLPAGRKITLRFAEVKYPDLPEYKNDTGMIMLENIRAAMAQDIYITRGGNEIISPRFTYHGCRYIEITGIAHALPLYAVKGDVLSSVTQFVSNYETSNPKVNQLWKNITWSTAANFMSIPTDCPQRNERLGWSGDISVFSRTATYLANIPQFLRRHMTAMRDVQRKDGRFTDVAPLGGGFGDTLWGSAGITVTWESYQQYGDKDLLAEQYSAMKKYIQFLLGRIDPQSQILDEQNRRNWASLGDWLSPEYDKTEKTLLWDAYFAYDLEIMTKVALVLNKAADAAWFSKLYQDRKTLFNKTYLDKMTGKTVFGGKEIDTQTSYAVPLALGLISNDQKRSFTDRFATSVSRENKSDKGNVLPPFSLMTGFIGTAWISAALSDNGHSELAYRQLQQTSYPSWLYPIDQGATTIWERLNSYTKTEGFGGNNNMNSFNHYSFGAVGAWMQNHSLGIQRDEKSLGFKHFILAPEPDPTGKMTYAKGYYQSMYGKIESSWVVTGNACNYHFRIPANTSATLHLSAASLNYILENNKIFSSNVTVKYHGKKDGKFVFELSPGSYDINVKRY